MSKKLKFSEMMAQMGPVDHAIKLYFEGSSEQALCGVCQTPIVVVDNPAMGVVVASCEKGCSYSRTKYTPKQGKG